ncbi:PREDICTED: UDP-glycosyltransferase [Prunus dulcis]|uniref:Glycosyltransferase n=1 Tax=Prunus dulcis TaxID=3755 RepID=A0A5E4EP80_PRUDU|nr:UDP-glycosyltransferase 84B2-like isoform X1 [Prunus dulcis]XP_034218405.1 UDP-glycosyltransferase 84B2-like isoform X2 [Prunus dulcis]VVA17252.1 PREDICTED: UDP-glycosyltransferase [Prunus dulcis]
MAADKEEIRVLLVVALQAHMNPMLKFARCLASKGVFITLAMTETARDTLLNFNTFTTQNPKINLEFFSDGLTAEFNREKGGEALTTLQISGSKNLSNLIKNLTFVKKLTISCIIFNPFVPWVADVAAELGIPCALLWNQSCATFSILYRYSKKINPFDPNFEMNPSEILGCPGIPNLEVNDLPSTILPSTPFHFKKLISDSVQSSEKASWVLGNSFYELEKDIIDSMESLIPIRPIGPLVSSFILGRTEEDDNNTLHIDMWEAEESCIEWLNKQPISSVIYASFGRVTVLSQIQIDNIAMALKTSKRPFLWVLKAPTEGSKMKLGELPSGFLEETRERGMVVNWCSQEKVLMHKAVACFMTHGGWSSTLETVASGVPVVVYPEWTDQPTNAKLLADVFRVGVRIRVGEDGIAGSEEMGRCIEEVVDGPRAKEMKKRALELKEAAKKAVEDGGSSDLNINQFIREISGKSCQDNFLGTVRI